jgi:membrane protease YdiL (CAAX protease family)
MAAPPKVSLQKSLTISAICLGLAIAVTLIFHPAPKLAAWTGRPPLDEQLFNVFLLSVLSLVGILAVHYIPWLRPSGKKPSPAASVDLSGAKPLMFSLLAGVGEETLFRGALQPLWGIWLTSLVFAALHFRTARFAQGRLKQLQYLVSVFAVSVGLGFIFERFGLSVAIALHAALDIVALSYWHVANTRMQAAAAA